jgi:hypothetical protein
MCAIGFLPVSATLFDRLGGMPLIRAFGDSLGSRVAADEWSSQPVQGD